MAVKKKKKVKKTFKKKPCRRARKFPRQTARKTPVPPANRNDKASFYKRLGQEVDQQGGKLREKQDFYKFVKGDNFLRFFKFAIEDGEERLWMFRAQHWKMRWVDENRSKQIPVPCRGTGCPICDLKQQLDGPAWNAIRPNKNWLVNAVIRRGQEGHDIQQVVALTISVVRDIRKALEMADKYGEDLLDLKKGSDFNIERTGSSEGFDTGNPVRYNVNVSTRSSPIGINVTPLDVRRFVPQPLTNAEYETLIEDFMSRRGDGDGRG